MLEARGWWIFRRIAIHLLRRFPAAAPDFVAARLTHRALFDEMAVSHEYALLGRECFKFLTPEQQQVILGWIETGPDLGDFKDSREGWMGRRPTDEDEMQYRERWQSNRLAWFKEDLPSFWRQCYDALIAKHREPEHPEFINYFVTSWVGPTSPKTAEEL